VSALKNLYLLPNQTKVFYHSILLLLGQLLPGQEWLWFHRHSTAATPA